LASRNLQLNEKPEDALKKGVNSKPRSLTLTPGDENEIGYQIILVV